MHIIQKIAKGLCETSSYSFKDQDGTYYGQCLTLMTDDESTVLQIIQKCKQENPTLPDKDYKYIFLNKEIPFFCLLNVKHSYEKKTQNNELRSLLTQLSHSFYIDLGENYNNLNMLIESHSYVYSRLKEYYNESQLDRHPLLIQYQYMIRRLIDEKFYRVGDIHFELKMALEEIISWK